MYFMFIISCVRVEYVLEISFQIFDDQNKEDKLTNKSKCKVTGALFCKDGGSGCAVAPLIFKKSQLGC